MKRKVALLLLVIMIFSLMTPVAMGQTLNETERAPYSERDKENEVQSMSMQEITGPYVNIWGNNVVTRGDTFYVDIAVRNVSDFYGASLDIKYDSNLFEVVPYNGKPVDDSGNVFLKYETTTDPNTYINRFDPSDSSIIQYAIFMMSEPSGINVVEEKLLGSIEFRVKDTAVVTNNYKFTIANSQTEYDSGTANILVKLSDSNGGPIGFDFDAHDGNVYLYDPADATGVITLDWNTSVSQTSLELDAHWIVPGAAGDYNVSFEDYGNLTQPPYALLLYDNRTNYWNNYTAQEPILFSQLQPGSEYWVRSWDDIEFSTMTEPVTVTLNDGTSLLTYNLADASGTGVWWHVFSIDASGNIVEVNTLDNNGPAYYLDEPEIDITSDYIDETTGHMTITGIVYDFIGQYNGIEVTVNGNSYPTTINGSGNFTISVPLETGVNFISVIYDYGTDKAIKYTNRLYNVFHIGNTPIYDYANNKYSGDMVLRVYDDVPINADFSTMTEIYADLYYIDKYNGTLELKASDVEFSLVIDKYIFTTEGIPFNAGEKIIVNFYSDANKLNPIGIGEFGIYPTAEFGDLNHTVYQDTITVNGYLAFADPDYDQDQDFDSLKLFVNEDPDDPNSTGIEITNVDANGNFSVDITLQPGDNHIELELKYDYGYMSAISRSRTDVYYDNGTPQILAPTIVPLGQQTHDAWKDGEITDTELSAIQGEHPDIPVDVQLPTSSIGTGYREAVTDEREGYWLSVVIKDNSGNQLYSTMSPIDQTEIDNGVKTKSVPVEAFDGLTSGETYMMLSEIVLYQDDQSVNHSSYSAPESFTYRESTQLSNDATLSDLTLDGVTIAGFNPSTLNYNIVLPTNTTIAPVVDAIVNDPGANITSITQASSLPGTATVTVISEDEITTKVYTINFTVDQSSTAIVSVANKSGVNGSTVTVPITITNGSGLAGLQFDLNYDQTVVQVNSVNLGTSLSNFAGPINTDNPGVIGIAVFESNLDGIQSSDYTIANIEFQLIGQADTSTALTLNNLLLSDESGNNIETSVQNGRIDIISVVYGDVTGDGNINIFDAMQILKHIVGKVALEGNPAIAADVTGDGNINIFDAMNVLKYIVGKISVFPVEQ